MRFHSRLLLTVGLLLPLSVQAANMRAADTIAGLQADIQLLGFSPNAGVTVSVTSPSGDGFDQIVTTDGGGNAIAVVNGDDTEEAGTYSVRAPGASASFTVLADRLSTSRSSIATQNPSIDPDGSSTALVVVTLRDRFGNPLKDRPVSLISSRSQDVIVSDVDATDASGNQSFRVATTQAGTISLRAIDLLSGMTLDSTVQINAGGVAMNQNTLNASLLQQLFGTMFQAQVTGGIISRFELTVPAAMEVDKEASKITVRAVDSAGNTVESYQGTIQFQSSDGAAALPNFGQYTFKARDLGQKEFPLVLKFRTPGTQTLTVKDMQNAAISGTATVAVTGKAAGDQGSISITSPLPNAIIGGSAVLVEGSGPPLINIAVKGGAKTANGDTDQNGRFSISVPVDTSAADMTLTVEDDQGRFVSKPVTVRIDAKQPDIGAITFTPTRPEEGAQTLVLVKSEPDLASVTMTLNRPGGAPSQPVSLLENPAAPGSYQAFFSAPEAGTYQPTFQTTDVIGNTGNMLTTLIVDSKSLPVVTQLRGEAKTDSVTLEWTPVSISVAGYRIYVGEEEGNYLYTLDTGVPQTKATVKGLQPGHHYVFAVTALQGNQESPLKSNEVSVDTVGIRLLVSPQDSALQIDWSGVPPSLPLQSYLLEYGVADGVFSERRFISGDAESYTLRDLINGVAYFLKLTPITVTGEPRTDLAVTANSTPSGDPNTFRTSPGDPIPGDLEPAPIIGENHEGAPDEITVVGFRNSIWMPAAGIALLLCAGYMYRRHRILQTQAFLDALARSRS